MRRGSVEGSCVVEEEGISRSRTAGVTGSAYTSTHKRTFIPFRLFLSSCFIVLAPAAFTDTI